MRIWVKTLNFSILDYAYLFLDSVPICKPTMWMVKILVLSEGISEKLTGPLLADWIPVMDGIPR